MFGNLLKQWRLNIAEMAHARGDFPRAINKFSKLIESYNSAPGQEAWTWYLHRGLALRAVGKQQDALRDYQKASALNPRSHKPHLNAALVLGQDLGQHDKALIELKTAIQLKPDDVDSLMSLGLSYGALGDKSEAEKVFRKALGVQPAHLLVLYNLGNLYLHSNRLAEAVHVFQQALVLNPHNQDQDVVRNLAVARLRKEVWERDAGKCVKCGSSNDIDFTFMGEDSVADPDRLRGRASDLQLLCAACKSSKKKSNVW